MSEVSFQTITLIFCNSSWSQRLMSPHWNSVYLLKRSEKSFSIAQKMETKGLLMTPFSSYWFSSVWILWEAFGTFDQEIRKLVEEQLEKRLYAPFGGFLTEGVWSRSSSATSALAGLEIWDGTSALCHVKGIQTEPANPDRLSFHEPADLSRHSQQPDVKEENKN